MGCLEVPTVNPMIDAVFVHMIAEAPLRSGASGEIAMFFVLFDEHHLLCCGKQLAAIVLDGQAVDVHTARQICTAPTCRVVTRYHAPVGDGLDQ